MSYEEKFNAAVNVIRNLPKNGAYQPSHELMLRFYAYYKQATEGPNTMPKPSFWEVIKRAKWDAWSKLGNMSREQAMISYVDELKKIVETMAYTDNVATFITSLDSFYESVPAEDLHMLIGPVIEKVRSQPGSPLTGSPLSSREVSPQRVSTKTSTKHITSSLETSPASSYSASPLPPDTDEEEDFLDTFEQTEPERVANGVKDSNGNVAVKNKHNENPYKAMNGHTPLMANGTATPDKGNANDRNSRHRETRTNTHNGHINNNNNNTNKGFYTKNSKATGGGGGGGVENGNVEPVLVKSESDNHSQTAPVNSSEIELQRTPISDVDVSEVIRQTLSSLRNDLESLNTRMNTIERNCQQMANSVMKKKKPTLWWPLDQVPVPAAVFFIVWPFVVQALILWIQRRKRRA